MNCKQCNQPMAENEFFCKHCGYQTPLENQREKVAQAKASLKNIFVGHTRSPLFLVFTICFTVMMGSQVINMFSGGLWGILTGILPTIFMIIATVGLWMCFAAKDNATLSGAFIRASIYDAFQRVWTTIGIVLFSILAGVVFILVLAAGESDAFVAVLILLMVFAGLIVAMVFIKKIYAQRRDYFMALSKYAENGIYTPKGAPIVGSFVLGGWSSLGAIFSFASSALVSGLGYFIDDILGDFGFIDGLMDSLLAGAIIAGLSDLIFAAYYICSAIWMKTAHNVALAGQQKLDIEIHKFEEIDAATKAAVNAHQTQTAQTAQATMQEQQNAMMQMMMQQMMNNMNNAAAQQNQQNPNQGTNVQ